MSGHSKWASIKTKKNATDAKRASLFTKLYRNIVVAAKNGKDPETNFKLRLAIDKAKEANMPKDNIERAIAKGAGEIEGEQIEEIIYEGYGPAGVAILIEATTDNRNRTTSELKNILTKNNGSLGGPNSVKWLFEQKGVIRINQSQYQDQQQFELELIDLGADDVQEEGGGLTVYTSFENFPRVKKALEEKKIKLDYAAIEWIAKDQVPIDADTKAKLEKLYEMLEEQDDINSYYSNSI